MARIPLVNTQLVRPRSRGAEPWMPAPVRYAVAVLAFIAVGVAISLTLETFGRSSIIGCTATDVVGCDEVLGSVWSKFLGLPVAVLGLVCYVAIVVLSLLAGTRNTSAARPINTALAWLTILAVGSGVWFTSLQFVSVGKICPRCLAVHLCGLTIFGLLTWSWHRQRNRTEASLTSVTAPGPAPIGLPTTASRSFAQYSRPAAPWWSVASGGAMAMLGLLVVGQVLFPPKTFEASQVKLTETIDMNGGSDVDPHDAAHSSAPKTHVVNRVTPSENAGGASGSADEDNRADPKSETPEKDASTAGSKRNDEAPSLSREVSFLDGKLRIDLYKQAVIGSPEAPFVVIEIMDYTCPHCRKMHANIKAAFDRYGDQLAVVIMPMPLELECNKIVPQTDPMHRGSCKIAKLALSVATAKPSAFEDYHNWLLTDPEKVPDLGKAIVRAQNIVSSSKLKALTSGDAVNERIQRHIRLFTALQQENSANKTFGLPIQIVGNTVLSGGVESADDLFEEWEKAIDIKPR